MTPLNEEELEQQLKEAIAELKYSAYNLESLKKDLLKLESIYIDNKLTVDKLTEDLRQFRNMYPSRCKQTK